MTQHTETEPLNIAALLASHPTAAAALAASIAREQVVKAKEQTQRPVCACQYCGDPGTPQTVAGRVYYIRSSVCCERAMFDDALVNLRYFTNPAVRQQQATDENVKAQRADAGKRFKALHSQITDPELLAAFGAELSSLATIGQRVSSAGGYCQGSHREDVAPQGLRVAYDAGSDPHATPPN